MLSCEIQCFPARACGRVWCFSTSILSGTYHLIEWNGGSEETHDDKRIGHIRSKHFRLRRSFQTTKLRLVSFRSLQQVKKLTRTTYSQFHWQFSWNVSYDHCLHYYVVPQSSGQNCFFNNISVEKLTWLTVKHLKPQITALSEKNVHTIFVNQNLF